MVTRKEELLQLQSHTNQIDNELNKILQHLQWDRRHLLENNSKAICKYDIGHRVPQECIEGHEMQCRLAHFNYSKEDKMLPEPLDYNAKTLIKLSRDDITKIITQAAIIGPSFNKENVDIEPQTLDRLQSTYTADERRAIYDAVVRAAPFCHDLSDLALLSEQGHDDMGKKQKSRLEILAELRDMKRRRTKYRVAAKTRNYSDVLRDVIKTQMEMYSDVKVEKGEISTSNCKWNDDLKVENNKSRPSNSSSRLEIYQREHSRSKTNEDRPSSSKKTRYFDDVDSRSNHRDDKYRRYMRDKSDDRRGRDRHFNRESSKHDGRMDEPMNGGKRKDRIEEHRSYKKYDEDKSLKDGKKYESRNESMHRRERHSSRTEHNDEHESKRRYTRHEPEPRKDKRKYEHRK